MQINKVSEFLHPTPIPKITHLSLKVNLHSFFKPRNGIFILCHIHKKTHI